jgi:UDP-N-acetylglucosamine--N-acetylmuramyl-(pentapeptide) pyrophosphoryl-undecaprenol N-acetylglucosamine transferase
MKQNSKPNIFLLAGRTGGPFFPLPTFAKNLGDINPIYVGVKGGFEEKIAVEENLQLLFLPETKLSILSFKKQKPSELIKNLADLVKLFFMFGYSVLKCLYFGIKYKPKMVISTGSFLAVPVFYSLKFLTKTGILKTKFVVHQQDPEPGIANRLAVKKANLISSVFDYTKLNFKDFKTSLIVPNPIEFEKYEKTKLEFLEDLKKTNTNLYDFISIKDSRSLLFIFGGGSGSQDINLWVLENLKELLHYFRIIHLYGAFQSSEGLQSQPGYFLDKSFSQEMVSTVALSDVVLCRAGLGSISELLYLQKPTFLAPLPHSHQELNAKLVKHFFWILDQKDRKYWLTEILARYPLHFKGIEYPTKDEIKSKLEKYYSSLRALLDN